MARDGLRGRAPPGKDETPGLQSVLDALDDEDCRRLIRHLEEPMTATELSEETGVPSSTTYRKLDLLEEASLVDEGTEIRRDGHHASVYRIDFEEVRVRLTDDRTLDVEVSRPARDAEDRIASMWAEVRKEA